MKSKLLASEFSETIVSGNSNFKQTASRLFLKKTWKSFSVLLAFLFLAPLAMAQTFTEDFESGIPPDWGLYNQGAATINWQHFADGYESNGSAFINPAEDEIGDGNSASYYLVTPYVTLPENPVLYFKTTYGSVGNTNIKYKVMISTAPQPDLNDFILAEEWTAADVEDYLSYNTKMVSLEGLGEGMQIYVAFVLENTQEGSLGSGVTWWVDDVMMASACSGVNPDTLEYYNITTSSAEIMWSHPSSTYFDIQVVEEGEAIDQNGGDNLNSFTYFVDELLPETSYDVYIRTHCDGGVDSGWELVGNFETLKFGMVCSAPIELSDSYYFEGNINEFPNVNMDSYSTHGSSCFSADVTDNYLAGNKIFFSYTAQESGVINIKQNAWPWQAGTTCYGNAQSAVLIYDSCDSVGVECLAALRTTATNQPRTIDNFPVEAGETYIVVLSTLLQGIDASICFDFTFEFSQCPSPAEISYANLLQESVEFSWDNPSNLADEWEYLVLPADADAPSDTSSGTTTSSNENVLITGLEAGTSYNFYVRSICNSENGNWGEAFPFMTQCAVKEIPYFASLMSSDPESDIECWSIINNNEDQARWLFESSYVRFPVNQSFNGINDDYLVSPQVDLTGTSTKRIRFDYSAYAGPVTVSVLATNSGIGAEEFTQVVIEDLVFDETGWEIYDEKIIVIPDEINGIVNLAFYIGNTNATTTAFYVKNVNIEEMPACSEPLVPWVDNITATTADIGWTVGYEETQWEVFLSSITDPVPTADDTGVLVSTNQYTLEDLEPGTQYHYFVRAYCNSEDQSEWVGPVQFNTSCNTIAINAPYTESFDDIDPETNKFCWTIINGSDVPNVAFQMVEDRVRLQTPAFGFPGQFDEWLISPLLNLDAGVYNIQFDYRAMGGIFSPPMGGLQILVSDTDLEQSSFVEIEPLFSFNNPNFDVKSIYYEQETSGELYIAIRVPAEAQVSNMEIDNFVVELLDFCPSPTNLTVSEISATSALISWDTGFVESEWDIAIQPYGAAGPQDFITITENPYLVEELDPITKYEVYVRSKCGGIMGESDWIGPVAFTTYCDTVFDTPFLETFENTSGSRDCWLVINQNNDDDFWHLNSAMNPYEGNLSAGLFTGNNGANNDWLITPTINITENQRLRFYYAVMNEFFIEDLKVHVSTSGVELEDFTIELFNTGENTINNEEYKEMVLNFPEGISGEIHVAFQVPYYPSVAPYRGQSLFIDNVIIEDIPACANPINLSLSNIQDESALLSWDIIGNETEWEVVVIPENEVGDLSNIDLDNINPEFIHTTQDMPYLIEDLLASQRYFIAVRAKCSDDEFSLWPELIELVTVCDLENLCQYTITLYSDSSFGVGGGIDVIQNERVIQTLVFPTGAMVDGAPDPVDYVVYVCNGVEFSLFWDAIGPAPDQYPGAWVKVTDSEGNLVFDSEPGIGVPRSVLFTGVSVCGNIECPQPENIQVDENMLFTWDAAGDEAEWEVAIKPVDDGTLPLSGTIVGTAEYTPVDSDFINLNHMTYDFYVRAVCSNDSGSAWTGPYSFVRGDSPNNAVIAPVNSGELWTETLSRVSFRNTHMSDAPLGCDSEQTSDIWIEFTATSLVHVIEVGGFTGNFYDNSGDEPYPVITTSLYKVEEDGELVEMRCSQNNVIVAAYASELEIGGVYKLRLTLNSPEISTRLFEVSITTPEDLCNLHTVNGDFERPELRYFSGIESIATQYVVPNWRKNSLTPHGNTIFIWEGINSTGANVNPYSGIQSIQLTTDDVELFDPNDPRGMYTDMNTSGIMAIDYSYAQASRGDGSIIQLYAGPVDGPYTLVREDEGLIGTWQIRKGLYEVPEGQDETRFMFVVKNYTLGAVLDLVDFVPNNKIISENALLGCFEDTYELEAYGFGEWVADENNPAAVIIEDSTSNETIVRGFATPGEYVFHWNTRYCQDSITITYEGIEETPEVDSPVVYCVGDVAEPLTASSVEGYNLVFYTEEFGGEPMDSVTPDTSEAGVTTYYVAYVDADGCEGARVAIDVEVNDNTEAVVLFEYDNYSFCPDAVEPEIILSEGFTHGGVFTSTPSGLALDAQTGYVDIASSATGVYQVTYTVESDDAVCLVGASHTVEVEVVADLAFHIYNYCDSGRYMLGVDFMDADAPDSARYTWTDDSGIVLGAGTSLDVVAAFGGDLSLPSTIHLSVELGDCTFTNSITLDNAMCEIPKGISPNGDGLNDSFDLSGLGVQKLVIFNRYGTKVYTKDNYINEWAGQSDKGKDLPDGTYYYVIETKAGESITGWVYLNRAY